MKPPLVYQVKSNRQETQDIFTLTLEKPGHVVDFLPGQFSMLYLPGFGEIPISISSNPQEKNSLSYTIRAIGNVTAAMQKLKEGDEIGVRGPFGSSWPLSQTGCDVLILGGGVGLAPLRPALYQLVANRNKFQKVTLLYGSRSPDDIMYRDELEVWKEQGIDIQVSVDRSDERWSGHVGVVTAMIHKHIFRPQNTLVFLCGPEIMIKFAIHELLGAQVNEENIYVSLERNMKCATGFCGHCLYGRYFLCKDGPIFPYEKIQDLFPIKEL